jgi:hypothetical protein
MNKYLLLSASNTNVSYWIWEALEFFNQIWGVTGSKSLRCAALQVSGNYIYQMLLHSFLCMLHIYTFHLVLGIKKIFVRIFVTVTRCVFLEVRSGFVHFVLVTAPTDSFYEKLELVLL